MDITQPDMWNIIATSQCTITLLQVHFSFTTKLYKNQNTQEALLKPFGYKVLQLVLAPSILYYILAPPISNVLTCNVCFLSSFKDLCRTFHRTH